MKTSETCYDFKVIKKKLLQRIHEDELTEFGLLKDLAGLEQVFHQLPVKSAMYDEDCEASLGERPKTDDIDEMKDMRSLVLILLALACAPPAPPPRAAAAAAAGRPPAAAAAAAAAHAAGRAVRAAALARPEVVLPLLVAQAVGYKAVYGEMRGRLQPQHDSEVGDDDATARAMELIVGILKLSRSAAHPEREADGGGGGAERAGAAPRGGGASAGGAEPKAERCARALVRQRGLAGGVAAAVEAALLLPLPPSSPAPSPPPPPGPRPPPPPPAGRGPSSPGALVGRGGSDGTGAGGKGAGGGDDGGSGQLEGGAADVAAHGQRRLWAATLALSWAKSALLPRLWGGGMKGSVQVLPRSERWGGVQGVRVQEEEGTGPRPFGGTHTRDVLDYILRIAAALANFQARRRERCWQQGDGKERYHLECIKHSMALVDIKTMQFFRLALLTFSASCKETDANKGSSGKSLLAPFHQMLQWACKVACSINHQAQQSARFECTENNLVPMPSAGLLTQKPACFFLFEIKYGEERFQRQWIHYLSFIYYCLALQKQHCEGTGIDQGGDGPKKLKHSGHSANHQQTTNTQYVGKCSKSNNYCNAHQPKQQTDRNIVSDKEKIVDILVATFHGPRLESRFEPLFGHDCSLIETLHNLLKAHQLVTVGGGCRLEMWSVAAPVPAATPFIKGGGHDDLVATCSSSDSSRVMGRGAAHPVPSGVRQQPLSSAPGAAAAAAAVIANPQGSGGISGGGGGGLASSFSFPAPPPPLPLFCWLLRRTGPDPGLLLDWLVSPETGFLPYLVAALACCCTGERETVEEKDADDGGGGYGDSDEEEEEEEGEKGHGGDDEEEEENRDLMKVKVSDVGGWKVGVRKRGAGGRGGQEVGGSSGCSPVVVGVASVQRRTSTSSASDPCLLGTSGGGSTIIVGNSDHQEVVEEEGNRKGGYKTKDNFTERECEYRADACSMKEAEEEEEDIINTCLQQLCQKIASLSSKGLFPYNPAPLLRKLVQFCSKKKQKKKRKRISTVNRENKRKGAAEEEEHHLVIIQN